MDKASDRRPGRQADPIDLARQPDFSLANLAIRPSRREVIAGQQRQTLQPRVMQVLVALHQAAGEIVSRDELISRCWDGRIVGEDAIHRAVGLVRRLGDTSGAFQVSTVNKVGYRLAQGDTAQPTAESGRGRAAVWIASLAAMIGLSILGLATWAFNRPEPARIVISPLQVNGASGAAVSGRVRDGMASVLNANHISVPLGDHPHARLWLTGSVDADGDHARVNVRLEDRRDQILVWQDSFEGSTDPEDGLAERVVARVTDVATGSVKLVTRPGRAVSGETIKIYVLGGESHRKVDVLNQLAYFRAFKDREPNLPLARAAYAEALHVAAREQPADVAAAWDRQAAEEANRVVQLDPKSGGAYLTLYYVQPGGALAKRAQYLAEGLKRDPFNASLNVNMGLMLAELGRPREGLAYIRRGQTMDPYSPQKQFGNTSYLGAVGQTTEAYAQLRKARRVWPDSPQVLTFFTLHAVDFADTDLGVSIIKDMQDAYPAFAPEASFPAQWDPKLGIHVT